MTAKQSWKNYLIRILSKISNQEFDMRLIDVIHSIDNEVDMLSYKKNRVGCCCLNVTIVTTTILLSLGIKYKQANLI